MESEALHGPADATGGPMRWRLATVERVIAETPRAKTILLDVPDWPGHSAGQYLDVRVADANGNRTERSYSVASAPEDPQLALTVERIENGEVSRYLTEQLGARDGLEVRGPRGDYFSWRVDDGGPLLLVARGPGLVPLMAMLRHQVARSGTVDARLLLSARAREDVLYRDELAALEASSGLSVHYTFTRDAMCGGAELAADLDTDPLPSGGQASSGRPRIFVCGPAPFIGAVAGRLAEAGYDRTAIRVQDIAPAGE